MKTKTKTNKFERHMLIGIFNFAKHDTNLKPRTLLRSYMFLLGI